MVGRRVVLVICALALAGLLPPLLLGAVQGGQATFNVNFTGNGSGSVTGDGVGSPTCSYNGSVESGDCQLSTDQVGPGQKDDIVYTANAAPGSTFVAWVGSGCDDEDGNICRIDREQVDPGDSVTVTAFFETGNMLTVTTSTGGKVTSSPSGIDCGLGATNCTETYPLPNTQVRLTATPMVGYVFVRWEGNCANFLTNICDLIMNGIKTTRAVFAQPTTFPLMVTPHVGGVVASSPAGINCGGALTTLCSTNFPANSTVQLTATPAAGHAFLRWEGDCATVEILVCAVVIDNATVVAAVFVKVTPKCRCKDLTVAAPKRVFGSAEGVGPNRTLTRLFFSLNWTLRCTAGTGNKCRGTFTFDAPDGFKNVKKWRLVRAGGRTNRVPDPGPVACEQNCRLNQSTITNGTVRVNMDSTRTFDQLAGKSFEFKATTKCSGEETTYVFTVAMGADGRINSVRRSIEI